MLFFDKCLLKILWNFKGISQDRCAPGDPIIWCSQVLPVLLGWRGQVPPRLREFFASFALNSLQEPVRRRPRQGPLFSRSEKGKAGFAFIGKRLVLGFASRMCFL